MIQSLSVGKCLVILDGWHRCAAHWLENKKYIDVILADQHWMMGKNDALWRHRLSRRSETDSTWMQYQVLIEEGLGQSAFQRVADDLKKLLKEYGRAMPKMRYWEAI